MDIDVLINRVLKYRAKHNISQVEMAKKLNVGEITLHNFMNKKTKPLTNVKIEQKLEELEGEQ